MGDVCCSSFALPLCHAAGTIHSTIFVSLLAVDFLLFFPVSDAAFLTATSAHASHVVMSVVKMMTRIVDPQEVAVMKRSRQGSVNSSSLDGRSNHGSIDGRSVGGIEMEAEMHDHTFGEKTSVAG